MALVVSAGSSNQTSRQPEQHHVLAAPQKEISSTSVYLLLRTQEKKQEQYVLFLSWQLHHCVDPDAAFLFRFYMRFTMMSCTYSNKAELL